MLDAMAHERIIKDALAVGNQKIIDEYKPFNNRRSKTLGAWSMALNRCSWEHYLNCGYTGDYESHLDDYGWFEFRPDPDEVLTVYEEKHKDKFCRSAFVEVAHLPNGKWVSGLRCLFTKSGCMESVDIFNPQFPTRQEALCNVLKKIVRYTDGEPESVVNAIKKGITAVWQSEDQKREPIQFELF